MILYVSTFIFESAKSNIVALGLPAHDYTKMLHLRRVT
jgi:hypothetical protein